MGSNSSAPPRNGISNVGRALILALILSMFLLPGCKFGGNPVSPDSSAPGVSPDPFMPNQPGTPLDDPRTGGQSSWSDSNSSVPWLELIGPEEIINYEYPHKLTVLQSPEFRVKLHNFSGDAEPSMFICYIDGEKALPVYSPAEKVVSFTPDNLLADGNHTAMVAFTGADHIASAGMSFEVCTEPPNILTIMYQPKKGLVRVCFDRALESAYALNMDNWKVNDIGGVFADAEMPGYGGGTQIILRISSPDVVPKDGSNGYRIGFHSREGLVEGWLSKGPIDGWPGHGGEVSGNCSRAGQSEPCDDCEGISVEDETYKHVSEQHEFHHVWYKIVNPEHCRFSVHESFTMSIVENDLWYDEADPVGSFWRDEDTTDYRREPEIVSCGWVMDWPDGCYHLIFGKECYVQGLSLTFHAECGDPLDWHLIGGLDFGSFPTDIVNCDFESGPFVMTGPEAAAWLEGQRGDYTDDPDYDVHIPNEEMWGIYINDLNAHPCSYYAVTATKDDHVNNIDCTSRAYGLDVLDGYGNFTPPTLSMTFAYLMMVDESPFYWDEVEPVGLECDPAREVHFDGFWEDEIAFGCTYLDNFFFGYLPALAVRLRAYDGIGNWKRSNNLLQHCSGINGTVEWAYLFEDYPSKTQLEDPGEVWRDLIYLSYCDDTDGDTVNEIYERLLSHTIPILLKWVPDNIINIQAGAGLYPQFIKVHVQTSSSDPNGDDIYLYPDISLCPGNPPPPGCPMPIYYRRGFEASWFEDGWATAVPFEPYDLQLEEFTSIPASGPFYDNEVTPCLRLDKLDTFDPHNEFGGDLDDWDWAGASLKIYPNGQTCHAIIVGNIPGIKDIEASSITHKRNLAHIACGPYPDIIATEANVINNGHEIVTLSGTGFAEHLVAFRSVADVYILFGHGLAQGGYIGTFKKSYSESFSDEPTQFLPNHTLADECRFLSYHDYLNADIYFGVSTDPMDTEDRNILVFAACYQMHYRIKQQFVTNRLTGQRSTVVAIGNNLTDWKNLISQSTYTGLCGYLLNVRVGSLDNLIQGFLDRITYPYNLNSSLWDPILGPPSSGFLDPAIMAFMEFHCQEAQNKWNDGYRERSKDFNFGLSPICPDEMQAAAYDGQYLYRIIFNPVVIEDPPVIIYYPY